MMWAVLAAALAAVFLLGGLCVGLRGEYTPETAGAWLRIGPAEVRIFPRPAGKRPDRPKETGQDRPSGTGGGQSPADAGTQKSAYSGAVRGTTASGGRFMGMPGSMLQNQSMNGNLSLIMDVPLNVSVEIGKTRRRLKDVLNFSNGTVVELDKQSDAPVDIIVNGQLIARGEVVVIDDNFGVRISEIVNTRSIIGNGE